MSPVPISYPSQVPPSHPAGPGTDAIPAQTRFDLSAQIPVPCLTTLGEELHRQERNVVANGTMAALRKSRPAPGLELDTTSALPGIGPRDVLVAVRYAGICGTDHHIFDWDEWSANRVPLGIVVGHEFTGTVAAVGEGV